MSLPENSLSAKKAKSFLGRAQIDLRRLQFGVALRNEHREESKKAQNRLLKVFEFEGCRRLDPENFVDALISRECFDTALFRKGITLEAFKESCSTVDDCVQTPIKLDLNTSIQCLNGLQRIRAAEAFLDNNDKWWIVNLYEDATFERTLETHLYESYNHEQQYTDGIIFRNIRRYARVHDTENEKKWWARLTATKRKDLAQLLSNQKLSLAFDALIDYAGLWTPIRLGTLHRFHALKCTKELKSYLRHIHTVWDSLIPNEHRVHVDSRTVSMLEMLAPSVSTRDAARARQLMLDGCIFPQLEDIHARNEILNRIQSQKCMIPSLRTFFEDQKYLEPCSKILKQLLGVKSKRPIWKEFKANYWEHESKIKVQISETKNLPLPGLLGKKERAKLGYLQLWMFCFRHWPEMTSFTPRLESGLKITDEADMRNIEVRPKSARRDHNPALWQRLACLAMQVGFETSNICKLAGEDAEMVQAKQFLNSARPEWESNRSDCERKIADILKSMQGTSSQKPQTPIWVDDGVMSWPREKRCGKPHEADHEHDKSVMFATMFYHPLQSSQTITSALVKRNVLEAFFDKYITPVCLFKTKCFSRLSKNVDTV
ncbi:hypothetical protein J3E72DRAFT_180998 [Bipolaris maydis]|nr:hypothetical protein J3E72DRAFT_180998 [Bipolaris maydis]KAJ6284651.1 hypothetical protein J3E71DRAFT_170199 [Bipolaris maydis]